MVAQRRYSVTGQTPPDDAEAMKARSPKLQALDTSVQTSACGLCEAGADAAKLGTPSDDHASDQPPRGRKMAQPGTTVRTSSKRSATQLPSPSSPSHDLPPKIARYSLGHQHDADVDVDVDMDADADAHMDLDLDLDPEVEVDVDVDMDVHVHDHGLVNIHVNVQVDMHVPCTGDTPDDDCMEHFALSPPHSRNHSLDHILLDRRLSGPQSWTFLTLPPEIRHQIYRNCDNLVLEKPLVYCISTFDGEMQHPLASVSRQVRSEALAIFYSYNTWVIKVEFRMMYEAFQDWIIRLGDGARLLRLINFSVRGSLFKPKRTHTQSVLINGQLIQIPPGSVVGTGAREELYCPPDGDASFKIDLSEKFAGGKVLLVRNDGSKEAGEKARLHLSRMVAALWEKRRAGTLNGQDWVTMVDNFITFIGGW
ncbi:hypothetical protein IQ07DRAFT_219639 [Pyrenochaeta sp. DS3sAY3a]|nr:hypothetical protein IQ07DRAFT_219639 [Pyrenochaeta sp. DS3sAY3a]